MQEANTSGTAAPIRVSIGMPVYNGEAFIEEAIGSILSQSYRAFELIISDNGSTDRTREICEAVCRRDARVTYVRSDRNQGASWNFGHTFELSHGEYFKWAAHDDVLRKTFLERCVTALDHNPSAALAYTRGEWVDEKGRHLGFRTVMKIADGEAPSERFRAAALASGSYANVTPVFGLMRSSMLEKTDLIANYAGSDRILLGQLALLGRFCEIPEPLFVYRQHAGQSVRANKLRTHKMNMRQFDTWWAGTSGPSRITAPRFRMLIESVKSIGRAPISWMERFRCFKHLVALRWRWMPIVLADIFNAVVSMLRNGVMKGARLRKG